MSEIIKPTRRGFITGLTSLIVAPAIVRVENLMPVKVIKPLTIDEIAKEVIKLFKNSNCLIEKIDLQYSTAFVRQQWIDDTFVQTLIPNEKIYVKAN